MLDKKDTTTNKKRSNVNQGELILMVFSLIYYLDELETTDYEKYFEDFHFYSINFH